MIGTRHLSKSGVAVSDLGLGCASLAGIFSPVTEADARATIDGAFRAGLRYFDTAPSYGYGLSERRVGDSLRGLSGFTLSSKAGRLLAPGAMSDPGGWPAGLPFTPRFDYTYDGIMRSFEDSLQRLGLSRIDIIYLHDIGAYTHGTENGPQTFKTAMSEGYRALETLRRSKRIGAIGIGVNETAVLLDALDHGDWDVFLLAGRYTLLEQAPLRDLFPACAKRGIDMVIGGPFNSGILAGGTTFDYGDIPLAVRTKVKAIASICLHHNVELPAAALQFCRAHPQVKSTILWVRAHPTS
ncbi:MAG: aldo/keto reductase [Hyphomicrobiales bacterium]